MTADNNPYHDANFEVVWLVDYHVVKAKVQQFTSIEMYRDFMVILNDYINAGNVPLVHVILDFTELTAYPKQAGLINEYSKIATNNPKLGWVIVITHDRIVTFLSALAAGVKQVRFRSVKTYDEAIAHLKYVDATLADTL